MIGGGAAGLIESPPEQAHDVAALARLHHLVIDCPEPRVLARFYSALLGQPITYDSDDWVVVAPNDQSPGLAFQATASHTPPDWPAGVIPQQMHLDVMVEDISAATQHVIALGARPLSPTVFTDPAGHPFCLIPRPGWAPPIPPREI